MDGKKTGERLGRQVGNGIVGDANESWSGIFVAVGFGLGDGCHVGSAVEGSSVDGFAMDGRGLGFRKGSTVGSESKKTAGDKLENIVDDSEVGGSDVIVASVALLGTSVGRALITTTSTKSPSSSRGPPKTTPFRPIIARHLRSIYSRSSLKLITFFCSRRSSPATEPNNGSTGHSGQHETTANHHVSITPIPS